MNVYDELVERGFIAQVTDEDAVRDTLSKPDVVFYVGFDSTATSLHAGSLVPIMAMLHLQRAGHVPIFLTGGGTTMIGDPSGKTEMREMLSETAIRANGESIHAQVDRYFHFHETQAMALDNAEWLLPLKYIPFLRDIGVHFSVNRMLAAEAYRQRMERGLSFIEFNYQLLQAYDYLTLYREHGCTLQMGGDDQWGNILAGVDLIRRVEGAAVHAMTFPLLTTASGAKMGKTAEGAVWIDAERSAPYDFYQYWINCDDRDAVKFLKLFTFLPLAEIARFAELEGAELREAKRVLAYEATQITHGREAADEAAAAAKAAFGAGGDLEGMPTTAVAASELAAGIPLPNLLAEVGLARSRGEARRMIQQGGAYINDERVTDVDYVVGESDLNEDGILLRVGKKRFHRVTVA
ncbi:MAG: tyrosine--tRNA ligase [Anaerolineae bacterium]